MVKKKRTKPRIRKRAITRQEKKDKSISVSWYCWLQFPPHSKTRTTSRFIIEKKHLAPLPLGFLILDTLWFFQSIFPFSGRWWLHFRVKHILLSLPCAVKKGLNYCIVYLNSKDRTGAITICLGIWRIDSGSVYQPKWFFGYNQIPLHGT